MTEEEKSEFLAEVQSVLELGLPFVWGTLQSHGLNEEGRNITALSYFGDGNTWEAAGIATALSDHLRRLAIPKIEAEGE